MSEPFTSAELPCEMYTAFAVGTAEYTGTTECAVAECECWFRSGASELQ